VEAGWGVGCWGRRGWVSGGRWTPHSGQRWGWRPAGAGRWLQLEGGSHGRVMTNHDITPLYHHITTSYHDNNLKSLNITLYHHITSYITI
jgi:hypothetical protein